MYLNMANSTQIMKVAKGIDFDPILNHIEIRFK